MRRIVLLLVLMVAICQAPGCGTRAPKPGDQIAAPEEPAKPGEKPIRFVEDDELDGLRMKLREVGAPTAEGAAVAVATGEPLAAARVAKLLERVEALKDEERDRREFALRKGSAPPPRTGETVDVPFPPPEQPPVPERGKANELVVLRFAPEGEVPLAPHLSITFDKPMVAVTSQQEASRTVPARLTPEPAGDWRWLGTRTLLFKPEVRFPMATDYEVEVPKGTKAATGEPLAKATRFGFSTPPLGVVGRHPVNGPHGLEPVIFIEFDQRIDQQALAPFVTLKRGGDEHRLRLATAEEIAADAAVAGLVERAEPERWIALKAERPLPKDSSFTVSVAKGAPSAEGPKTTPGSQSFTFRTYAPLKIVRHRCGWNDECPPTADWRIEFNNPLDGEAFDPEAFAVEPTVTGQTIRHWHDDVTIAGLRRGRTTYTVTVPGALKDVFGQTLGEDERLTFDVGPAEKTLFGPSKMPVTLDPAGPPVLPIHTINHPRLSVLIHRVTPEDWDDWTEWLQRYRYDTEKPGPLPGKRVYKKTIRTAGEADVLTQTQIDLAKLLKDGHGQFLVRVEPVPQAKERWNRQEVLTWVQVTDLGLAAFVDDTELLAWTTQLADGKGLGDVELELLPGAQIDGRSDETGLARLELGDDAEQAQLLVARRGTDAAILPASANWWWGSGGWRRVEQSDQLRWYTFDDRGLYRPGEEVRVKGWIRKYEPTENGDIRALTQPPDRISWKLRGSRGNDLLEGEAKVSRLSGFDIALELPGDANLGTAWLELTAIGSALSNYEHRHAIEIQEFRRPEFEVSASADPGPWVLGQEAEVHLSAAYYAGGGLPGAPVTWRAYASTGRYVPPDRDDFQFGAWSPWWRSFGPGGGGSSTETLEGKTDALGEHHLGIHFEAVNPPQPMNVRAEATVTDVNRQAWTAKAELLVHPADLYVGLRTARGFVGRGDPIDVEALVVDLDGKAVPDVDVTLEFARLQSSWTKGKWEEQALDPVERTLRSAAEASAATFMPEVGGSYRLRATIRDALGRRNQTEIRVWVAGGEQPPSRDVEQEELTLIPERQEYQPGDTARFLLQSPFYPAEGLLTVRRSGLVRTEHFLLDGPTHTFEVPILEAHIPQVTVQVDLVGAAERTDDRGRPVEGVPRRVAYGVGKLTFEVPPLERTLAVTATPRDTVLDPGGETVIDLAVKDAAGKPVANAELAVAVADESVLALTGYKLPDPIKVFYTVRGAGVSDYHSRSQVLLIDPAELVNLAAAASTPDAMPVAQAAAPMMPPPAPGGGLLRASGRGKDKAEGRAAPKKSAKMAEADEEMAAGFMAIGGEAGDDDSGGAPIEMRSDFRALALFAPEVTTDAKGRARVPLTLPDSLTRYRVMVVAVAGGQQFGTSESAVTARLPLMVRPSAPRFLNFGDRFELPIVLQNQTAKPLEVEVAVRGTNVVLAESLERAEPGSGSGAPVSAGRKVTVPAEDRVEVRFPAAADLAGTARFQVVGASGRHGDAATFSLPVWTPATSEAFATYGEIDEGALVQPVRAPGAVWPQFGGLEITTSSTQLQALTDAVLYLVSYPFDCNEQIASRVLAIAALKDVLGAFEAEGLPAPAELKASVKRDLERLKVRQNWDGGFAFWRKGDQSWPYLTIHVGNALARAKAKGYDVPPNLWSGTKRYLDRIERHIPAWYSKESKWTLRGYALYVRHRMGDSDLKKARELLAEAGLEKLPLEAQGWILPVLHAGQAADEVAQLTRNFGNKTAETAAGAHFVTGYSDGAHVLLHSDRRVDGVILESLIEVDPRHDVIPKLVRGLLAHRTRGKWSNTQENAFVLTALDRYFNVYEKVTPDFVARAWLGERFAGEHKFKGRTTERARIEIPMAYVAEQQGDQALTLQKDGKGRLYYRIGMRYAPRDLELAPADYGFAVERVYEAVDDPAEVKRDADGTWRIKAGARVRVKLTMVAPMRRYHVALVDPLPAGLEPINPELATSETLPDDPNAAASGKNRYWWWWRTWYEHQNMRDERVEAFGSLVWDGVHSYDYVARATTPGVFVVPPTKAEEMYHPETFGRSATDKVIVE